MHANEFSRITNPGVVRCLGLGNHSPKTPISGIVEGSGTDVRVSGSRSWAGVVESEGKLDSSIQMTRTFANAVMEDEKNLRNRKIFNGLMLGKIDRRDEDIIILMDEMEDEV